MKDMAYKVFVDIWRLACRYHFSRLDDSQWERFTADAKKLMGRYRGTPAGPLFRYLFAAVQKFYEKLQEPEVKKGEES